MAVLVLFRTGERNIDAGVTRYEVAYHEHGHELTTESVQDGQVPY